MLYYFIISLPFVFMLTRLFLTNFIIPHFKKKSLYSQMKERCEWPMIERADNILKKIYKGTYAKMTSIIYRHMHLITNNELIYGEIDFLSFFTLLEKTKPQHKEIFYDLGSGAGKAVFTAALFFDLSKSCGIELLPPLYRKANHQLKKASRLFQNSKINIDVKFLRHVSTILFINDNFLQYDFCDANIIYVAATCLSDTTWEQLINKMADLSPGCRIIVATKSIEHSKFELIYQGVELMSWGLCPVKIYKIKKGSVSLSGC